MERNVSAEIISPDFQHDFLVEGVSGRIAISEFSSMIYSFGGGPVITPIKRHVVENKDGGVAYSFTPQKGVGFSVEYGIQFMTCNPQNSMALVCTASDVEGGWFGAIYAFDTVQNKITGTVQTKIDAYNYSDAKFSPDGKKSTWQKLMVLIFMMARVFLM